MREIAFKQLFLPVSPAVYLLCPTAAASLTSSCNGYFFIASVLYPTR